MTGYKNMAYSKSTRVKPLSLWRPNCKTKFNTNMQENSPFIVTRDMSRTDLGTSVISTTYPRFVARFYQFRTQTNNERLSLKYEQERQDYILQRLQAIENGCEAEKRGMSVRTYVEVILGRVYDEEFDEPRPVAKIPGLNAYLELRGCMDELDSNSREAEPEYALKVLEEMSAWAQNIWTRKDRIKAASVATEQQPLPSWEEDFNPALFPVIYPKHGIGFDFIDPSRRPESSYVRTSIEGTGYTHEDIERIKSVKMGNMIRGEF